MVSRIPLWASVLFYHDAGRIIGAFVWPLLTLSPVGPSWLRVSGATSPISRALGPHCFEETTPLQISAAIELQSLASIGCMHPITRRAGKFVNTSVACRLVLSSWRLRPTLLPSRFPPWPNVVARQRGCPDRGNKDSHVKRRPLCVSPHV